MTRLHTPTRTTALAGILLLVVAASGCGDGASPSTGGGGGDAPAGVGGHGGTGAGIGAGGQSAGGGGPGGACTVGGLSVDAGYDQSITLPTSSATFTSLASDSHGNITRHKWTQRSGPHASTLTGASSDTVTASDLVPGKYVFRVTVDDDDGACASDDVALTVSPGGTNYYISSSQGDDSRTSEDAHHPETPWKSVAKVDWSAVAPGDSVLLRRGDVFTSPITVGTSGTEAQPVVIGAYGTGAKPIVTGLRSVSGWSNIGGSIWESHDAVSDVATLDLVVIHGKNTAMGRSPNTGYWNFTGHSGHSSITDSNLDLSTNWTGGEVVIRVNRWVLERNRITSQSGHTLNYDSTAMNEPLAGFGYFIENHPATLDSEGEWYYVPGTKKLRIFSASSPTEVQASTVDTLLTVASRRYVTLDSLSLQGANTNAVEATYGNHLRVQNCDFAFTGGTALDVEGNDGFQVVSSTFDESNGCSICGYGDDAALRYNVLNHTGLLAGMAPTGAPLNGITWRGANPQIDGNRIDGTGHDGIFFGSHGAGDSTLVTHNVIRHHCSTTDDGGGIYCSLAQAVEGQTAKVTENIVLDGNPASSAGTNNTSVTLCEGVYLDDDSARLEVFGNSVAHLPNKGIFLHNAHDNAVHDNTTFDAARGLALQQDDNGMDDIRNNAIDHNLFVALGSTQLAIYFLNSKATTTPQNIGVLDFNVYARPVDDDQTIMVSPTAFDLAGWQQMSGQDAHSKKSWKTAATTGDVRFEYNDQTINKTVHLDGTYKDHEGTSYTGQITMLPYSSAVLIKQ